jgi:hypothetical protein
MSESEKLQAKEAATKEIIKSTALYIAALLGPDMDGAECIRAIHQFAQGVEECEPVYPPASPTKRVRAAAYVVPSGNWVVLGFPDGEKPYSDKAMVEELFSFSPPDEDYAKVCMVDIDLPLPVLNPEEVIRAASVEEVAE